MAAPREILTLYRLLLKELRTIYPKEKLKDGAVYHYITEQFHEHQVTSEKLCRNKTELEHVARTYLCLLQSVRKYDELHAFYKGAGERSVQSAAHLVGLELPKVYEPADKRDL